MIAIIPARGGSKELPGKNIKLLNNKPLIAYTIEAALKSTAISRVIISTDDKEIARIAVEYGADCPFMRPDYLASDESRSIDVMKYTISELEKREGINVQEVIILQPTSPLRTFEDIDKAVAVFKNNNADSVISYCKEHHPIKWHKYITPEGKFEDILPSKSNNRHEEAPTYFPNGAIYILRRELIEMETYYTDKSFAYIMDRSTSVDIDSFEDFEYCEYLIKKNA